MEAMEHAIPVKMLKPFPVLVTRYLCGAASSADLGLNQRTGWFSRFAFSSLMFSVRVIDWLVRRIFPEFSITRFFTRVLGYHFMTRLLMDQTRPLKLPQHLLNRVSGMMDHWSEDPRAPGWMNSLEGRLTIKGSWRRPGQE